MKPFSKTKRKEIIRLISYLENQTRGEENKEKLEHLKNQIKNLISKL